MDKLQINTNGKGKGPVEIPETSSRRVSSLFQPSSPQFQPDNHRPDEHRFRHRTQLTGDLGALESSFSRLSFADSDHVQNSNQILHNSNSILHNQSNQVINGGDLDGRYGLPHRRAIYGPQLMYDHRNNIVIGSSSNWNDSVHGSYVHPGEASSSVTHNNGFFNHNVIGSSSNSVNGSYVNPGEASSSLIHHNNGFFNDYPYFSMYSSFYQSALRNGFGSGINNYPRNKESFGYNRSILMNNHLPSSSNWNDSDIGSSSNWNDSVSGSYVNPGEASSCMNHNNGFFNKNLQDYPYLSRYSFFYQNPWDGLTNGFGSGIKNNPRNNGSFSYNHDLSPPMNSQNLSILSRAKHPVFSKLLQKMIAESPREVFDTIFKDLNDHVCDLMEDAFGHEVVQSLMVNCSSEQITEMVDKVTKYIPGFAQICFNPHGTRVIQLLLRYVHSGDQIWRIVETISRVAYSFARNSNAQLVIVKCFEEFNLPHCGNLVKAIAQNIRLIAKDRNGCIMLQNLLREYGALMQPLIQAIISNALLLCHDSSGNYVFQLVMVIVDLPVATHIMSRLRNNYVDLSCDKHGSHVVQRLLQIKGIETGWIVRELLQRIDILVVHEFANYVIQTALDVSEENMFGELWRHIEPNIPLMRCNMYGKKILEKMKLLSIKLERTNKFLL